jgi:hypothetical protein
VRKGLTIDQVKAISGHASDAMVVHYVRTGTGESDKNPLAVIGRR